VTAPSDAGGAVDILYVQHEAKYRLDSLLALLQNLRDLVAVVSGAVEDEYRQAQALAKFAPSGPASQQSELGRAGWWIAHDLTLTGCTYRDRLHLTFVPSKALLTLRPVWEDWVSTRPPVDVRIATEYAEARVAATELLGIHLRSTNQHLLLRAVEERKETALRRAATALTAIDAVHWG